MTAEHLTIRRIDDYRAQRLEPDAILAFYQHVEECPGCREMLAQTIASSASSHLIEQQAVDYLAARLTPAEKTSVEEHRAQCPSCAAMLSDLEEFRQSEAPAIPARRRPSWNHAAWALPIAAAILFALGLSFWTTHSPAAIALHDRDGLLQWSNAGLRVGSAVWGGRSGELVASSLRTGSLPPGPPALPPEPRGTLRGETQDPPALAIVSPSAIRVIDDRPQFTWSAAPGLTSFQVTVTDDQFQVLARSPLLTATTWIPGTALPRGRPLFWQVSALRHGQRVTAPAPPAPSARFTIIPAEAALQISEAQRHKPFSHLLLANLYAEAGLHREAQSEAEAIVKLNPGSPLALRLLESARSR